MVAPALIEARGIAVDYAATPRALDGVELAAGPGELVALLGPNGAGKSTLLRVLAGLLAPRAGDVRLAGRALARFAPRERARRIAFVPQALRALPDVTVEGFAAYGRYAHLGPFGRRRPADRAAVERALAEADLADLRARPLAELSGGQRQRALIARALAQESELLLVDEPTASLDPEHQVRVFDLLARLAREGHAAIVVTHELNLASQFATRALLLDAGRPAAAGTIADVLRRQVLEPVYGPDLWYGRHPAPRAGEERPIVVPWLRSE